MGRILRGSCSEDDVAGRQRLFHTRGHKIGECFFSPLHMPLHMRRLLPSMPFPYLVPLVNTITGFQDTAQTALQNILLCIPVAWYNAGFWFLSHFCNYGFPSRDSELLEAKDNDSCFYSQCLALSGTCTHVWIIE